METSGVSPYFVGDYAPIQSEHDAVELVVEGELPRDLNGAFVRNGPNAKLEPKGRYHWFDGDGMLHAIRFSDGRAFYSNRWVRTEALAAEEKAGHSLWTGLMESTRDNPKGAPYKDTANTDVIVHGDSLIALWYICGAPYRIDPRTLETRGIDTFGRDRVLPVSAHAKVEPKSGDFCFFSYGVKPPFMHYGVVDLTGELAVFEDIELPGPRLPHDMAISENYAVLMDLPVFFRPEALREKRWLVDFYREMPSRFGILPRRGPGTSIRWFEAEPCYIYHTINAWEEGDEVVMVGCRVDDPIPAPRPSDGVWSHMLANLRVDASLHRWRFNLETGETREERLDDLNSEFPSINANCLGQKSRFTYNAVLDIDYTLRFTGLVKYDTDTARSERYDFGPGRYGSEAPFAPRDGGEGEDDGYVISIVHDSSEGESWAEVIRAQDFSAGPIARMKLPTRVPLGFHACWVPGDIL